MIIFFSFAVFSIIIYYLLSTYKGRIRDVVTVGLLYGLISVQIQFLVFGGIIIAIYSLFFNKLMSIKQAVTIVFIGIILNFYWLLNFFVSQSISSVSTTAKAVSFSGSSYLDVVNIFNLSFSKATLIHKFFDNTILILNSLIFIIIITTWLLTDKPTKTAVYIRVSMIVFMAFTIFANLLSLVPGVNVIYPMFREVGHMAPLVLFFLFLLYSIRSM